MFQITDSKGFHLTFANGFTVSVQWGPSNYCERRDPSMYRVPADTDWSSSTAEVAVIGPNGDFVPLPNGDDVSGWHDTDFVAQLIAWAAQQPATATALPAAPKEIDKV